MEREKGREGGKEGKGEGEGGRDRKRQREWGENMFLPNTEVGFSHFGPVWANRLLQFYAVW